MRFWTAELTDHTNPTSDTISAMPSVEWWALTMDVVHRTSACLVLGETEGPSLETADVTDAGLATMPYTVTMAMMAGNSARKIQNAEPAASIDRLVFDIWYRERPSTFIQPRVPILCRGGGLTSSRGREVMASFGSSVLAADVPRTTCSQSGDRS